jgi:hypothetical protein
MRIYGIYDITNKEQCLRIGTLQEIIKFLNLPARAVDLAIKRKTKIKNKYDLVYLFNE